MKQADADIGSVEDDEAVHALLQLWLFTQGLVQQARWRASASEWPLPGAFEFLRRGRN